MGKHLQLIGTIVPLILVALGLVSWVFTLRSDISTSQVQIVEMRRAITLADQQSTQTEIEINKLNKLIEDFDEIEAITEEVDVLIFRINELTEEVNNNSPGIAKLKTDLAVYKTTSNPSEVGPELDIVLVAFSIFSAPITAFVATLAQRLMADVKGKNEGGD
jgi:hypothetical protein